MDPLDDALQSALNRFSLSGPCLVTQTGAARLFKAKGKCGAPVALKLYSAGTMGNERLAVDVLHQWRGPGVVRIIEHDQSAVVMDWVDGPLLGQMVRDAEDERATQILAQVAKNLHAKPNSIDAAPSLENWFGALFKLAYSHDCPSRLQHDMQQATSLARDLLHSTQTVKLLHGDLHHDNVIMAKAGPVVIDPKGVLGDPAYELANALRNPKGAGPIIRDPARLQHRIAVWAEALDVTPQRLLQWGAAKCALSIAWRAKDAVLDADREADLLHLFLNTEAN